MNRTERILLRLTDAECVPRRPRYPTQPTEEDRRRIAGLMEYAEQERLRLLAERNRWRVLAWIWAAMFIVTLIAYTWAVYGGAR
jgi:hypothetical protein